MVRSLVKKTTSGQFLFCLVSALPSFNPFTPKSDQLQFSLYISLTRDISYSKENLVIDSSSDDSWLNYQFSPGWEDLYFELRSERGSVMIAAKTIFYYACLQWRKETTWCDNSNVVAKIILSETIWWFLFYQNGHGRDTRETRKESPSHFNPRHEWKHQPLEQDQKDLGIPVENQYVFARPSRQSQQCIWAWDSLCKFALECETPLANPDNITSTKLRKYIATVSQILSLKETEVDWLARPCYPCSPWLLLVTRVNNQNC